MIVSLQTNRDEEACNQNACDDGSGFIIKSHNDDFALQSTVKSNIPTQIQHKTSARTSRSHAGRVHRHHDTTQDECTDITIARRKSA